MLDITQELIKYKEIPNKYDETGRIEEIEQVIQSFIRVLNRIGKDQYKNSEQLSEIIDLLEEHEKDDRQVRDLREKMNSMAEENNTLLNVCINAADCMEEIYRYVEKSGSDIWKEQFSMQWEKLGQIMEQYGIIRLEGKNALFDVSIQIAKGVTMETQLPSGQVVEVLRSGYIYNKRVVRKAEVIVNQL